MNGVICLILMMLAPAGQPTSSSPLTEDELQPYLYTRDILDREGDAVVRGTTTNITSRVDPEIHNTPDVIYCRIGNWRPTAPDQDIYTGQWKSEGPFVRLDVAFHGRINPPGLIEDDFSYDPFRYGNDPVFGVIEFDVDADPDTGGETNLPLDRYLANAARFGGRLSERPYANRLITCLNEFDGHVETAPFVERSGEEYHISLLGKWIDAVYYEDNRSAPLTPGETWIAHGHMFHRAHVYERFSGAGGDGAYEPESELRFHYAALADETTMTFVFPLTNDAAASMLSLSTLPERFDDRDDNQASAFEGLDDIAQSLRLIPLGDPLRSHPDFPLVAGWESYISPEPTTIPASHPCRDASQWRVHILVGMAYVDEDPTGETIAWTDASPGPEFGDFDGDGLVTLIDVARFDEYLETNDENPLIDGGHNPHQIDIIDFGPNFSIFDLNYDGVIDMDDRCLIPVQGDFNGDLIIDSEDLRVFVQILLHPPNTISLTQATCQGGAKLERADFNQDGRVTAEDIDGFIAAITGSL